MTTLVTGATGLVGHTIAAALLEAGRPVRALVRSDKPLLAGVEKVSGDVTDPASLARALEGCTHVVHAAGLPEQWLKDESTFDRVNAGGTKNMLDAAIAAKVKRFVHVSTIDVFAAETGAEYDESVIDPQPKGTPYERSKQKADRFATEALERGLDVIFIHPSAVYGPGPAGSPGLNDLIEKIRDGKAPMLPPGGMPVVYSRDLGAGVVAAIDRAAAGARYIFTERYYSVRELGDLIARALGRTKAPPSMPLWLAKILSAITEGVGALTGMPPLMPAGQLYFLQWGAKPKSDRARAELGWSAIPFEEGVRRTIDELGHQK